MHTSTFSKFNKNMLKCEPILNLSQKYHYFTHSDCINYLQYQSGFCLMLGNLEQLQTNLQSLLAEFTQIKMRLVSPIEAKKDNRNTLLILLPKVILIIKVCPYLDYEDIIRLSATSSALRKSIFGPIGWKLLNRVHSPYPITIRELINHESKGNFDDHSQLDSLHYNLPEDEKNLRKSRLQCKKQLMQSYERYKLKQEEHDQLKKKLRVENTLIRKLGMQKQFLKNKEIVLREQNVAYRNELKSINIGFSDTIIELNRQNDELIQENIKLQNQKGALVNKIREYQNDIETIKYESEKHKAILKRIKNYLLYKEL